MIAGLGAEKFSKAPVQGFPTLFDGWMYPKNSMLKRIFDHEILEIYERGIGDKLLKHHKNFQEPSEFVPVNFEFALLLFAILTIGVILSLCTFVLELFEINIFGQFNLWP